MYKFKLPDIGEGVAEGEIVAWKVKEGDKIAKDQDMVEVMTDKVNVSIPSPVSGTVKRLLAAQGSVVKVGSEIIEIDDGSSDSKIEENNEGNQSKEENKNIKMNITDGKKVDSMQNANDGKVDRVIATPTIRRIAKERGIDIETVVPTGPNGRITIEDLDRTEREMREGKNKKMEEPVQQVSAKPQSAQQVTEKPAQSEDKKELKVEEVKTIPSTEHTKEVVEEIHEEKVKPEAKHLESDKLIEMKGLRRIIFEKMTKSKQIMPHFMITEEADVTEIMQSTEAMRESGIKITVTPIFAKIVSEALKEFTKFNSIYDEQNKNYIMKKDINIGIAVDTPSGLTVVVVKNVDKKSIMELNEEIRDLAGKARDGKLSLSDVQDSTFTLTNVGSIGGLISTPIINYPEVAILATHRTFSTIDKNGSHRRHMYLSLSCDHRLIDGADAARFINRIREYMEKPFLLNLKLR
ncbi:dihydrolipoamide acetyltransferase family protein [Caldiplasma sukawensis]